VSWFLCFIFLFMFVFYLFLFLYIFIYIFIYFIGDIAEMSGWAVGSRNK